jgi:hypothetical protein
LEKLSVKDDRERVQFEKIILEVSVKIIRNRAFIKTIFLLSFISSIIIFTACSKDTDDEIPFYQEAIYIMDADGSNKTKVIDVDGCENVQFIPNSYKLLYLANNSLYTVNIDGTEKVKISGDVEVEGTNRGNAKPTISNDGNYALFSGIASNQHDLFLYEIGSNVLTNITNTNSVDELNPRFESNELKACFITRNDSLHYLTVIDPLNSTIDTLYTSNKRMPACLYSFDNQSIFFFEEYDDKAIDSKSYERDYYRTYLKRISINSLEVNELVDNSSNYCSYISVLNENYIIFDLYSGRLTAFSLLNNDSIDLPESIIYAFDLNVQNKVYFSGSEIPESGTIEIFDIELNETTIATTNAIAPALSKDDTKLCCIGTYVINPKSKNYLAN